MTSGSSDSDATPSDWDRLQDEFDALLALPDAQRGPHLSDVESRDPTLAAELRSLLDHDAPPDETLGVVYRPTPSIHATSATHTIGSDLGPYHLVRILGSGGMGTVYLAEQARPVRRTVALKVINPGLDHRQAIRRFEVEQESLALMHHPGIAAMLDAGITPEGQPFFAMEYIEGVPITQWCADRQVPLEDRLQLFVRVCRALQHAHERGVIHRDIKPSNILVTSVDDEPTPKIIDFGIARPSERRTEVTLAGQIVGTMEYMSPEQLRFDTKAVDTRSDIYSLGMLLYELLVGELPFDRSLLQSGGILELQRWIVEAEPPRPSRRASELRSRDRLEGSTGLEFRLRGDLDSIVLKALDKDRNRRYPSAAEFADDIERYLAHEPVLATLPSRFYLFRKFVRRNRVPVASALLVLLSLVVGLGVAIIQYRRADQRYVELVRLSDAKRLSDLTERARDLWPVTPSRIPALEAWVRDADELAARLPLHEASLAELRRAALPYDDDQRAADRTGFPGLDRLQENERRLEVMETARTADPVQEQLRRDRIAHTREVIAHERERLDRYRTWQFDSTDIEWQHDQLSALVESLRAFLDPDGTDLDRLPAVKARLALARDLSDRLDHPSPEWEEAIASIANPEACPQYQGLRIPPQWGLEPVGRDPQSGLWEFAVLGTGRLPARDPTGTLECDVDTAVVLVLLPGGLFYMGAARFGLIGADGPAICPAVEAGSFFFDIGVRTGDLFLELNDRPVADLSDLSARLGTITEGDTIEVVIEREGERMTFRGPARTNIDPNARANETPVHRLRLDPFFLSKYEVNQRQWFLLTGERPAAYGPLVAYAGNRHTEAHPVERVSWNDCQLAFSRRGLTLPTEAQWEYGARGGTHTPWSTGKTPESLQGFANIADRYCKESGASESWTYEMGVDDGYCADSPVGHFRPNPFGLHDMHGNVMEWCLDIYTEYDHRAEPGTGRRDGSGRTHAVRSGNWSFPGLECRSSARAAIDRDNRSVELGARPARRLSLEGE